MISKFAFYTIAPLKIKNNKEYNSAKGQFKETVNMALSSTVGGLTGSVAGGAIGGVLGGPSGAIIGSLGGAGAGSISGAAKAIRKGQKDSGTEESGEGRLLARAATSTGLAIPGLSAAGAGLALTLHPTTQSIGKKILIGGGIAAAVGALVGDQIARKKKEKKSEYFYPAG